MEQHGPPGNGTQHFKNRTKRVNRNRRFLHNAKSFGRKNSFGRGAELEQGQYNYLVSILEAMSQRKETEERQLMANNVLGQMEGKEIKTSSNQVGSRVLENLLTYADEDMFVKQMDTYGENLRVVCCDKFASHVLQRIMSIALLRAVAPLQQEDVEGCSKQEEEPQHGKKPKPGRKHGTDADEQMLWPYYEYNLRQPYDDEHRKKCKDFMKRTAKFLINNVEEFVWDHAANYVVRQCMLNLSGITEKRATDGMESKRLTVPEKWQKMLQKFTLRFLAWPQFSDLPHSELTSVVLQDLLRALAATSDSFQLEQLLTKLHNESFTNELDGLKKEGKDADTEHGGTQDEGTVQSKLPLVFHRDGTIRLLEVCIGIAPATFLEEAIFEKLFCGNLTELSLSRMCNFAVQKLIDHTPDKDLMDRIFGELESSIEEILRFGNTGVVVALAKACARLACQQGKFVKCLLDALHCTEATPAKLIMAILCLMPADVSGEPKIHIHGSVILQTILEFNKPIKFVNALLEMPSDQLAEILCDPRGSFVANAFVASRSVGDKSREKLARHLDGQYSRLALGMHGSRVLDILYNAGNAAQRESIVRELADECPHLNGKPWGIIINKRLLVDTYKRDPARWKVAIRNDAKVEKMFDKILPGSKRKAGS